MLALAFAILSLLGAFMQGPAMDSDPAPAPLTEVVARSEGATTTSHVGEDGAVVHGTVTLPGGRVETFEVAQDCTPWLAPETDRGYKISQQLIDNGWYGDPADGMEALYPPGC